MTSTALAFSHCHSFIMIPLNNVLPDRNRKIMAGENMREKGKERDRRKRIRERGESMREEERKEHERERKRNERG